jgi:hypothetical protein
MNHKNWWTTNVPLLAGIIFPLLSLFSQSTPYWARVAAITFVGVIVAGWLIAKLSGQIESALKLMFRRRKLKHIYFQRAKRLLSERRNLFSWSYSLSPYYVWHTLGNTQGSGVLVVDSYTNALSSWVEDIEAQIDATGALYPNHVLSLLSAIGSVTSSVDFISREIDRGVRNLGTESNRVPSLKREWNGAREHFNVWIREWGNLLTEIGQEYDLKVGGHYTPISPLE